MSGRAITFRPTRQLAKSAIIRIPAGPEDPIDMLAEWRRRKADHDALRAHRQRRADWYLCQRAQRTNGAQK